MDGGQEAERLRGAIQSWLDFYDADLSQARLVEETDGECYTCPSDWEEDPYFEEFTLVHDSPSLPQMSYSPDRQRYVDLTIDVELRDGVWHDTGRWGADQTVFLVDREARALNLIFAPKTFDRVDDIFWLSDDVFVMVGTSTYDAPTLQITVYDLRGGTTKRYEIPFGGTPKTLRERFGSYYEKIYLPSRGIVPHTK
jgi:hypothetical protein